MKFWDYLLWYLATDPYEEDPPKDAPEYSGAISVQLEDNEVIESIEVVETIEDE